MLGLMDVVGVFFFFGVFYGLLVIYSVRKGVYLQYVDLYVHNNYGPHSNPF